MVTISKELADKLRAAVVRVMRRFESDEALGDVYICDYCGRHSFGEIRHEDSCDGVWILAELDAAIESPASISLARIED